MLYDYDIMENVRYLWKRMNAMHGNLVNGNGKERLHY